MHSCFDHRITLWQFRGALVKIVRGELRWQTRPRRPNSWPTMPRGRQFLRPVGTKRRFTSTAATESTEHRLHPLEATLLAVVSIHLVFLPWALGTMHVWSQSVSFGFSVLSLGLAVWTRHLPSNGDAGSSTCFRMLPILLGFPIFWIGGLFLLYTLIQALNPAWNGVWSDQGWWIQGVSSIPWLPSGMRTPFAQASPWRALMIYSSAWMSVCAIWTGISRRKALRILLAILSVNAFLLALLGLLQRALHADRVFWFWKPPSDYFISSFIYRNHAGAYFDLMLAVACALGCWYYRRQIRRDEPSSPAVVFGLIVAVLATIVLYSYSRTATLLLISFLALAAAIMGRMALAARASRHSPLTSVFTAIVFVAVVGLSLFTLKTGQMAERMRGLGKEVGSGSENLRLVVGKATWAMFQDRPVTGWGAGSWSYCFPGYQVRYPEICIAPDSHKRMFFEHAHDDYLEFLAEYGVLGCSILVAGVCFYLVRLLGRRVWRNAPVGMLLLGCAGTLVHAAFDFPFANPAILITWCCLWPVMLRWLDIEQEPVGLRPTCS